MNAEMNICSALLYIVLQISILNQQSSYWFHSFKESDREEKERA